MPHFVVDCSKSILSIHDGEAITQHVHMGVCSTGLFSENNVQIRVNPFDDYRIGNKKQEFIHFFASILEGRTSEQKLNLSTVVVRKLTEMFPQVPIIGIDIKDLEKGTGFYKNGF